jgi:hypothetical protein
MRNSIKSHFVKITRITAAIASLAGCALHAEAAVKFKAIAFYTGRSDMAHISFVKEALKWFPQQAASNHFSFESTSNWNEMTTEKLTNYQVVLFLDTRPELPSARAAFENYMDHGGAWIGFHFSAFAMNDSGVKEDWDWYHNKFLGSGEYVSNTWRPTSAILRVEGTNHPAMKNMPATFKSAPNEWYRWKNDLRANPDIQVLLSIDPASFPLGTGPKLHEIWQSGDYPVVWANRKYRMIYMNMGHNDMDYEHKFGKDVKDLSFTFDNEMESKLILDSLIWLGSRN